MMYKVRMLLLEDDYLPIFHCRIWNEPSQENEQDVTTRALYTYSVLCIHPF